MTQMAFPINIRKLLAYPIPTVRQTFSRKDSSFYALSVGMGCDPLNEEALRFVDASSEQLALPSMALVLGHPGFWLAAPDSGVDPIQVVHAEQSIEWLGHLPAEGEVVGETNIVKVIDKGLGKAALLYTRKKLFDSNSGQLLAITSSTTFIRGGGGFGGESSPTPGNDVLPAALTDDRPDHSFTLLTRHEQALYYRLNGDDNPLHSNPSVARAAGFSAPILHGLCTFGITCHALVRTLGRYHPDSLRTLTGRFSAPVFPGETLRFDIWNNGAFNVHVVERDVIAISHGHASFE
jgi:acyl dehydratase